MKLNQIFKNAPDIDIEQLSTDSRLPMKNAIFFCLNGIKYDGHNYINDAIKNGAKVIIYSKDIENKNNAVFIKVKNVNETLDKVANIFYDNPNNDISKFLICGCYGRSSVSEIIKHYLNKVSTCGTVGIFGINYKDRHLSLTFPALTPLENIKTLVSFRDNGIHNAIFETSAISLYYKKFDVLKPNVFIYTNTSKFCSDYKVCNNSYYENIRRYLYTLEDSTNVLLNIDDESYNEFTDSVNNVYSYGQSDDADYKISNIEFNIDFTKFDLTFKNITYSINTKLLGLANVYNITSAIAALNLNGYEIDDIISNLKDINYVDGVYEKIDNKYNIIVDCGYEIDSIKNILEFARKTSKGKVIGILGINYTDSDERLDYIMKLCNKYLDKIILTEDESLQGEVMNILDRTNKYQISNNVVHISYRSSAILNAINLMNGNDTLLILGKGNEKYLSKGLGKETYLGDKHYSVKYINRRKEEEDEII